MIDAYDLDDSKNVNQEAAKISNKEIEIKKELNEIEESKWVSCCFQLHSSSTIFFSKLLISILVIALSAYQLITLKDCNYQSLYSSLLSSVITFWLTKK